MLATLKFNMTFVSLDFYNVYISKDELLLIIDKEQKTFSKEMFFMFGLNNKCDIKYDILFYFNHKMFKAYNVSLNSMFNIIDI